MAGKTSIEWTEQSWNPIVGCSIVSPGCTNCYAMKMAHRLQAMAGKPRWTKKGVGTGHYAGTTKVVNDNAVWTGKLALAPEHVITAPLRRKKPTTYFVNSMGDLFHEGCPDEWVDKVFSVMALTPQHTFQVLTKRAARMREYMAHPDVEARVKLTAVRIAGASGGWLPPSWPFANVWLGVSAEDQARADERIPHLLETPAAVRFISAEPLLGPIDFAFVGNSAQEGGSFRYNALTGHALPFDGVIGGAALWATNKAIPCAKLDWVIVGGESGHNARPMHPDWVRAIRDQCQGSDDALHMLGIPDVPFFFKQWGEFENAGPAWGAAAGDCVDLRGSVFIEINGNTGRKREDASAGAWAMQRVGKKLAGRLLDGTEHNGMPKVQS